jgi:hypothetical protein
MIESVTRTGGVNGAAQALMLAAMMQMMQSSNGPGGSQGQGSGSPIQMMLNLLSEMLKLAAQALKPQGQDEGQGGNGGPGGAQGAGGSQQAQGAGGEGELTPQTIMQLMQEIMKIMQKLMSGQQPGQEEGSPFEATPQANQMSNMLNGLANFLKGASDMLSGLSNLLGGNQGAGGGMPGGAPGGIPGGTPGGAPGGTPGGAPGGTPGGDPVADPHKPTTQGPGDAPFAGKVGDAPAGMPQDKWQHCVEAGKKTGQDPYVLAAMMEKESQFGAGLHGNSPSTGDGLMQVEPSTRQAYAAKFQEKMGHAYDHSSEADQVAMAGVILADKGGSTTNKLQKYNGGDNWQPGVTDSYGRVIEADQYAASVEARARELRASGGA